VINFAHGKIHFDKHIICDPASSRDFNPLKYIEMTLPFIKNPAAHGETQTYEFIRLPQHMNLGIIYKLLWPLTGMPNCESRDSVLQLRYRSISRRKQEETSQVTP